MVYLVNTLRSRVFLNSDRSMVQAIGCDGLIVASLPVSEDQFRALED